MRQVGGEEIAAFGGAAAHPHAAGRDRLALDIFQSPRGEALAHFVNVEADLAGDEALALVFLVDETRLGLFQHVRGVGAPDHANAVVIGDDYVAGLDIGAGADHGNVDGTERLLDRPLRRHAFRPDGEAHLREIAHVAHAGVDDEADAAVRLGRCGEQVAEIAGVGGRSRRDQQDVAGLQLLDRDMDHPIVARRERNRDRRGGDARAGVDRPHIRRQEPDAPLRFVDGRHAAFGEAGDHGRFRPRDGLHDDVHHSSSTVRGNIDWKPSAYLALRPPD